jgi:cytochrome c biogenesis protein CcmG/thiol:disulfide interchange protein DsbE
VLRLATPSCAPALPSRPAALRPATTCAALDAPRGRVVWLDFWAYWCGPCRLSFPWMDAMQSRFGAHGLQVLAVNLDATPEPARRFLAEHPASFAVGFDPSGDTARRFSVKAMPTPVLIGADGRVLATHAGLRDADRDALEATIRDALARRTASAGGTR